VDKRQHMRVNVDLHCRARFQFDGRTFTDVPVVDLSSCGCRIKLPALMAGGLEEGVVLDGWEWSQGNYPVGPVRARIVWMRDHRQPRTDLVESGVTFPGAPETYVNDLDRFVTVLSDSDPSSFDLYGMPI
jgi:hypothetical protein